MAVAWPRRLARGTPRAPARTAASRRACRGRRRRVICVCAWLSLCSARAALSLRNAHAAALCCRLAHRAVSDSGAINAQFVWCPEPCPGPGTRRTFCCCRHTIAIASSASTWQEAELHPHVKQALQFPIQVIGRIDSNGPVPDFVCPDRGTARLLDSNHNKAKTVLVAVNGAAKTPAARVINPFAANAVSSVAAHLAASLS